MEAGRMERVRHIILVLSGKGGVGKSTVSAQLALTLESQGFRVGLLDVDLCGPSIPRLLGLVGKPVMRTPDGWTPVSTGLKGNLGVMSLGFLLPDPDAAVVWRGPKKSAMIRQMVGDVSWGDLDYLIVDTPPGTSDEHLSVLEQFKNHRPDGAILVTQPQAISVNDVRKEADFCNKMGLEILGIVENMSGFACPHCSECTNIWGEGGGRQLAKDVKAPFLGRIPIDPALAMASEQGSNLVQEFPKSQSAIAWTEAAKKLMKRYEVGKEVGNKGNPQYPPNPPSVSTMGEPKPRVDPRQRYEGPRRPFRQDLQSSHVPFGDKAMPFEQKSMAADAYHVHDGVHKRKGYNPNLQSSSVTFGDGGKFATSTASKEAYQPLPDAKRTPYNPNLQASHMPLGDARVSHWETTAQSAFVTHTDASRTQVKLGLRETHWKAGDSREDHWRTTNADAYIPLSTKEAKREARNPHLWRSHVRQGDPRTSSSSWSTTARDDFHSHPVDPIHLKSKEQFLRSSHFTIGNPHARSMPRVSESQAEFTQMSRAVRTSIKHDLMKSTIPLGDKDKIVHHSSVAADDFRPPPSWHRPAKPTVEESMLRASNFQLGDKRETLYETTSKEGLPALPYSKRKPFTKDLQISKGLIAGEGDGTQHWQTAASSEYVWHPPTAAGTGVVRPTREDHQKRLQGLRATHFSMGSGRQTDYSTANQEAYVPLPRARRYDQTVSTKGLQRSHFTVGDPKAHSTTETESRSAFISHPGVHKRQGYGARERKELRTSHFQLGGGPNVKIPQQSLYKSEFLSVEEIQDK